MKSRALVLYMLLGGLAIQSVPAHADTRDLIDHMDRQRQETREQRQEQQDRSSARGDRRGERGSRNDPSRRDEQRGPERRELNRERYRDSFRGIGPGEAARRAQERNGGGRVLGVNPIDDGYSVRLLKQGEVRTLLIPQGE